MGPADASTPASTVGQRGTRWSQEQGQLPEVVLARRLLLAAAWRAPEEQAAEILDAAAARPELWASAARLASRVHQEPLFLHFLKHAGHPAALPPGVIEDLEAQSRYHAFRWEALREAAGGIVDALGARGIRPVLLKGISQAGEHYDPPRLRPMRDLDILVEASDIPGAREAAAEAGFEPDPDRHPDESYRDHHHAPPLFHAATGACLELHHAPIGAGDRLAGLPPTPVFLARTRPSKLFGEKAQVLEPTLEVFLVSLHVTHGDSIGRRAQNLIDLARTIEVEGEALDWQELLRLAESPDAARSLSLTLGYLAREGLSTAPQHVLEKLAVRSFLAPRVRDLLHALVDRYRLGSPAPWPLVSGRISNVLWRQALRRGSVLSRCTAAAWEIVVGRFRRKS